MPQKTLDILVVDDQPGVRYLLDIVIKESGHKPHTAQNGLEAVNMARSIRPDLIFMDVRMPIMGGLEALAKIKPLAPETRVIIMTAYGSDETIEEAKKLGALGCMDKPFDINDIKDFIQDYARQSLRQEIFYKANAI
ncbi:MAG TPA: response regulator [Desulfotomaculum sp.]|nr:MAG: histidine kinase [Peptococcaceae bacterium BRH_c8a]KJS77651.1 MAG: histidine kinase [Desulfotomaculum sp. BICA1-6]HBX22596.1 response regulator [Desulfotomaculum sp.]